MKTLFQPAIENNPFYKKAFDADFSGADNEKALKQAFADELGGLTDLIGDTLAPITSFTQVAEVFHYGALAAGLLQHKADYRRDEIRATAKKEYSVQTLIMSQFEPYDSDKENDAIAAAFDELSGIYINDKRRHAEEMSEEFKYTGSLMRALVMVATMSVCACRSNSMANAGNILRGYYPAYTLLEIDKSKNFPVIGMLGQSDISSYSAPTYSVPHEDHSKIIRDPKSAFCKIFAGKLAEILSLGDMDIADRARTEEMREFFLDTLVRFFFNLRSLNFPRVLSLIAAVTEHAEDGSISDDVLDEIAPAECKALLGNEAILSKSSVDMSSAWYSVNGGTKNFASLCKHFALMSGHKLTLLDAVIE